MSKKTIRDPIHGNITVPEWCVKILDTPQLQRLRRIKQLGFASLVYPGANHTRFEHSLGVMHITTKLIKKMECSDRVKRECVVAALLHDIAHAPFSHSSEVLLKKYLRFEHENIYPVIKGSELEDLLKDEGLRLKSVVEIVKGESVVSGDIDADRMDYLVRDSHYTGVAYGVFDIMRLVDGIKFNGLTPIISQRAIKAAESLLLSRFMMYPTVYHHHVCRIARKMYEKALEFCFEREMLEPEEVLRMDDYDMVVFLRNAEGFAGEIMKRLDNRKLFKRAIYVSRNRIPLERIDAKIAEEEIASMAGVEEREVIVDVPEEKEAREFKAIVEVDGEKKRLEEISPLISALKEAEKTSLMLGVYTPKKYVDRVAKAAMKFFGIKEVVQKKLDEVLPIW